MSNTHVPACSNCRHYYKYECGFGFPAPPGVALHQCKRNIIKTNINVITGEKYYSYDDCRDTRADASKCNVDGKWFEAKVTLCARIKALFKGG